MEAQDASKTRPQSGGLRTPDCAPPQQEFWLRCGGKPAAGDQARGWCSIPVGNRGSPDQGSNHRNTPKAEATASGNQWVGVDMERERG